MHPRKTAGADIQNGISVDQVAAQHLARSDALLRPWNWAATIRAPSATATRATPAPTRTASSWRGPTTPMPPETNPRLVFERLFGDIDTSLPPEARARRLLHRRSILDLVTARTNELTGDLGTSDRRKLDEYLSSIREIEVRIESAEKDTNGLTPGIDKPSGVPVLYADYVNLMFDLQLVAFQTDSTRIVDDDDGTRGQHADLSGNRRAGSAPSADAPSRQSGVDREGHPDQHACTWSCSPGSWRSCKETPDGDGTLLDHSMIVYGSGLSDGNRHTHEDLPVLHHRPRRQPAPGPPRDLRQGHADDEPVPDGARSDGRTGGAPRRQHRRD